MQKKFSTLQRTIWQLVFLGILFIIALLVALHNDAERGSELRSTFAVSLQR